MAWTPRTYGQLEVSVGIPAIPVAEWDLAMVEEVVSLAGRAAREKMLTLLSEAGNDLR